MGKDATDLPDDDLRARLAAADPLRAGGPLSHLAEPTPDQIREHAMSVLDSDRDPDAATQPDGDGPRRPARRWLAAAAALALVATAGATLLNVRQNEPAPATRVALSAPSSGVAGSCLPFDVAILRDMPVAFAGTATAVDQDSVTLRVDRWYRGGSADQVVISTPDPNSSVNIDGVAFRAGERYLITATDGTVNYCGFSGPATPELERAFAEAFPQS